MEYSSTRQQSQPRTPIPQHIRPILRPAIIRRAPSDQEHRTRAPHTRQARLIDLVIPVRAEIDARVEVGGESADEVDAAGVGATGLGEGVDAWAAEVGGGSVGGAAGGGAVGAYVVAGCEGGGGGGEEDGC